MNSLQTEIDKTVSTVFKKVVLAGQLHAPEMTAIVSTGYSSYLSHQEQWFLQAAHI